MVDATDRQTTAQDVGGGQVTRQRKSTDTRGRVHVMFTVLMCAVATAYRLPCAHEAMGEEPVGGQRWRRQLLDQTRDVVIVLAEGCAGLLPRAAYS
jgi:hypothetical protein